MTDARLCSVEGCDKPMKARGFCRGHYRSFREYGDPLRSAMRPRPNNTYYPGDTCHLCERPPMSRGLCMTHYQVWRKYGDEGISLRRRIDSGAVCESCGKRTARMVVDHEHQSGAVRGVLCHRCNAALGLLDEDVDLLMSLAGYLLSHRNMLVVDYAE